MTVRDEFPEHVRGKPVEVQLAVLYERVGSLSEDVEGMRRALWATVTAVVGGALLFLFSEAAGWIGPHGVTHAMHAFLGAFT